MALVGEDEEFRGLFDRNFPAVYRYVASRIPAADLHDAVADVFAVAWRRRSSRPRGAEERLWLFGVARKVLSGYRRAAERRLRLFNRLTAQPDAGRTDGSGDPPGSEALERAMETLGKQDRELLRLLAWDDLSRTEAAEVLGCSVNAVNIRLHRALKRLSAELGGPTAAAPAGYAGSHEGSD